MLKNNKTKKGKIGSEVTIHRRRKTNKLNILPNTEDQIPKSDIARCSNPSGLLSLIYWLIVSPMNCFFLN